jgi:hypothetical protein
LRKEDARASSISGDEHGRADRKDDWVLGEHALIKTKVDPMDGCCAFLPRRKAKKSHFTLVSHAAQLESVLEQSGMECEV